MGSEASSTPQFSYRISRQIVVGLVLLVGLIIGVSFSAIWLESRPKLLALSLASQVNLGQNISLALEQELHEARGIALSLAASASALDAENRSDVLADIVPKILHTTGQRQLYAGGGIWPEPFAFSPQQQRESYFWANNDQGVLERLNDYNAPEGPGYHNEEWYVPVHVLNNTVYWSKSYTDPYSQQPMVTCSAPMLRDGKFIGVATADLTLEGVSETLNQVITGMDAYAFIVDRNNRFIAFPTLGFDVSRTQVYRANTAFQYFDDLVGAYPEFSVIADRMAAVDDALFDDLKQRKPEYLSWVDNLAKQSYQIDHSEAKRLVANYWWQERTAKAYPKPLSTFDISNDVLLGGDARGFIYQMPSTSWRIVMVFERAAYGAISDTVSQKLFGSVLLSSIFFGVLALLLMKATVINRIQRTIRTLSESSGSGGSGSATLNYDKPDELGMIIYWFNQRIAQLEDNIRNATRANQAKTDFLTAMAHELKTPLNSILGFNRRLIVKLGSELDENNYKTLVGVQRSAHHLLSLISDILEVSELDAGKVKLKFDWESVNMLLDDVSSQMVGQIADAGLTFDVTPLKDDVRIFADRQKIIQVLLHLLANAMQATKEGSILLRAEHTQLAEHSAVCFSVTDTGVGLSRDEQHRIYRQFSQVDAHTGIEKGMGLGLYLIREITALHSGAVFFESTLGMGSSFSVLIPVSANLSKLENDVV